MKYIPKIIIALGIGYFIGNLVLPTNNHTHNHNNGFQEFDYPPTESFEPYCYVKGDRGIIENYLSDRDFDDDGELDRYSICRNGTIVTRLSSRDANFVIQGPDNPIESGLNIEDYIDLHKDGNQILTKY